MEPTDLMDAAGSSPESWRLEPKWLRGTYKRQISTDMKESLEAVDSNRVSFEQKSCDTNEHVGAVCNQDLCVILEQDKLIQDGPNVAGVTFVPGIMTDGQIYLAMLSSFVQSLIYMALLADFINIFQESVQQNKTVNEIKKNHLAERKESERQYHVLVDVTENTRCMEVCGQSAECTKLKIQDNSDGEFEIAELWKFNKSTSEGGLTNLKENLISTKYIVTTENPLINIFQEYMQQNKSMRVIKKTCLAEQQESERQHHVLVNITENTRNAQDGAAAATVLAHREIHVHYTNAGDEGTPRPKFFETIWWDFKNRCLLFHLEILRMVGWQNAHLKKTKTRKNR